MTPEQQVPDIYSMKLHEMILLHIETTFYQIIRVPGGWLYRTQRKSENGFPAGYSDGVFVPFNDESKDDIPHTLTMRERKWNKWLTDIIAKQQQSESDEDSQKG